MSPARSGRGAGPLPYGAALVPRIRNTMRKVVIGTAGHVDHGKTSLIKALTGIDCDRWAEEKRRGITLDLGFAHLVDDDVQLSFVDVPGHEHFLHNALAGLGGIGAVLLVIDASEGVRAQTTEHLEIVRLLDIDRVIVALSKIDTVDSEWLQLVSNDVEDFLQQAGFPDAPVHPVSAKTGDGLEVLTGDLRRCGQPPQMLVAPARLPVDRAFQIVGRGTVVTGSPAQGQLEVGDQLAINGGEHIVRVRGIEVHGDQQPRASVGERVAAQLAGVGPADVARGTQLVTPGAFLRSRSFAGWLTLLPETPALERSRDVRMHLFSSSLAARVRPLAGRIGPGESGFVEVVLAVRTVLAADDRAVLRRPSPSLTLGGVKVLDPAWRRPRGKRLERALTMLRRGDDGVIRWWAASARLRGICTHEVDQRLGQSPGTAEKLLQRLAADGHLIQLAGTDRYVEPSLIQDLCVDSRNELERFHSQNPLEPGMPKAEFVRRQLTVVDDPGPFLDLLTSSGVLVEDADLVRLPDRGETLDAGQQRLADGLAEALDRLGFAVPPPAELARSLNANPKTVEGLLHHLQRGGRAVKLPSGLWLSPTVLQETIDDLRASGWDSFGVGEFKDRYGLSRKWAIPVLEHLDSQRVTRRQGDRRVVLPATK